MMAKGVDIAHGSVYDRLSQQTLMQINMNKFSNIALSTECRDCPIGHRAVCARCDTDELDLLEGIKTYRTFKAGDNILWRGEPFEFVASVVSGIAALSKTLEDGRTQMVGLLLPSDFIGRPGREVVAFDVTATTDITLCCFARAPFERLVHDTPHIAHRLMELALDELDAARDWMLLLGRKTAREKIATFIELLARRSSTDRPGRIDALPLPMTRDQIANYLGLTLETVSRQFNALKKEGVIDFTDRKTLTIRDLLALQEATGNDADGGMLF
jgi:CRP/FNR family transcriptional regulator